MPAVPPGAVEEPIVLPPGAAEDPIVLPPGWVLPGLEGMAVSWEPLLGELGLVIVREEPVAPEDIPLPAEEPPPAVWLWTKAGTAKAEMLTARNACQSLLFFIYRSFPI